MGSPREYVALGERLSESSLRPIEQQAGYAREQVFDVLPGVAMKTLSSYTNHIARTPLDGPLEAFEWEPAHAGAGE